MGMESEMPIFAQLNCKQTCRSVPALMPLFSFGLDFHAFPLKLLLKSWFAPGWCVPGTQLGAAGASTCCCLLCWWRHGCGFLSSAVSSLSMERSSQ